MPIAIRFEAFRFVVHAQKSTAMGLWACSHRKCLEFRGNEIASGGILRPTQCFKEARQQFHMFKYPPFLPIASYSTDLVFGFPIVCLSLKPHPSQIRLRLEARQVVGKKTRKLSFLYCSQPSRKLQHITCTLYRPCVGVSQATALIGDTKQATSEGKSGTVETELTELVDMALL